MNTQPRIILIIVLSLSLIVIASMVGVFVLIQQKCDAAQIAMLSGMGGTALGGLMSMLNNTRSQPSADAPELPPIRTNIVNDSQHPIPTAPQK